MNINTKYMKITYMQVLSVCILLACASSMTAQERYFDERSIFTQHYLYPTLINPGAIGSGEQEIMVNYRNGWSDFDGSPSTVNIAYNGAVGNRLGFGAQLLRDSYASLGTTKGQVGLSYTIESPINKIGFGLSTEYVQHGLTGGLSSVDDPLILQRLDGAQFFDVSFGIFGLYNDRLIYGISLPSLISSRLTELGNEDGRDIGYIVQLGYKLMSPTTGITLTPTVAVKSLMNTPTHIDLNATFGFLDDKLLGGVGYTLGGESRLGFLIGTQVEKLRINYSYTVSSLEFQTYNNGGHEITLSLFLGDSKEQKAATAILEE